MYYLRIDDLRVSLLYHKDNIPIFSSTSVVQSSIDEALDELFAADMLPARLCVLVSGPTTIVPMAESPESPAEQSVLFNSCFCFRDDTPRRVLFDEIPALNSHLYFAVKADVCNAIINHFPDAQVHFMSAITPMLRHFSEKDDEAMRFRVYLNCRCGYIDALAFDGRQLVVLNSFPVRGVSDAVYYALAFSKTIGFEVASTPYIIVGDDTMAASLVDQLKSFAHNVLQGSLCDDFEHSPILHNTDIPYDLALHVLCAL